MRQMTLTQSRAPGCVIGWTNVSHYHMDQYMDFVEIFNISLDFSIIYFAHFSGH